MKYIIDDYDLTIYFEEIALAGLLLGDHKFYPKDFLKDKQQVKEIASGKVERLNCREYDESGFVIDECGEGEFVIGDKNISDILSKYGGKDIEIYIKETK